MTINNQKIATAGIKPEWATFRGFSLLFDNPGQHLIPTQNETQLLAVDMQDPAVTFYANLVHGLTALNLPGLAETYTFCPLPSASYHVTVWDGINDENVSLVSGKANQKAFQDLLIRIPDGLKTPLLDTVYQSELMQDQNLAIRFRFKKLTKWGDKVLVAQLEPADSRSETTFQQLSSLRQSLTLLFETKYGAQTTHKSFSPHISLGYFAHSDSGKKSTPFIEQFDEAIRKAVDGETIQFSSIGLYGFTDMASFYTPSHDR